MEPALDRASNLWTSTRVDYSNGQWAWTDVTQSGAYKMAQAAQNAANDAKTLAQNADTLSQTTAGEVDRLDKAHAITAATAATAAQNAASAQALLNVLSSQVEELLFNGGFRAWRGWVDDECGRGWIHPAEPMVPLWWVASLSQRQCGHTELVSTKPVAVTVGSRYRFRVWYKLLTALSGNDNGGLRLQYTSSTTVTDSTLWTDFKPLVNMVFTGDTWAEAVQEAVIPDGVKWVRARIAFTSPVDAYFDDCSLTDVSLVYEAAQQAEQATSSPANSKRIWRTRTPVWRPRRRRSLVRRPQRTVKQTVRAGHASRRMICSNRVTNGGRPARNHPKPIGWANRTIPCRCSSTIQARSSISGRGTARGGLT